jgi:S-adenosylmethionine hydrolase
VALPVPPGASSTFHGRDVFAPAAARLAAGEPLDALGAPCTAPQCLRWPEPRRNDRGHLEGEVLLIDRFGNAITNLPGPAGPAHVAFDACDLRVRHTYADVAPEQPIALTGSSGCVEIAVREGSAARRFALRRGTRVVLREDPR